MNYLQNHNIRHLDLKPSNILLTKCLSVKIADFDFSEYNDTIEGNFGTKKEGYISQMTPEYAAPEFFKGKHYRNSDIFSFGLVLYFVIFEEHYFDDTISTLSKDERMNIIKNKFNGDLHDGKIHFYKDINKMAEEKKLKYQTNLMEIFVQCLCDEANDRKTFQEISDSAILKNILEDEKTAMSEDVENAKNDIWKNCKKEDRVSYDILYEEMKKHFDATNFENKKLVETIKKYVYCQMAVVSYHEKNYQMCCKDEKKSGITHEQFVNFMNLFGIVLIKESEEKRGVGINPFEYLYNNLWSKPWYFDDFIFETGVMFKNQRQEKKKKNVE